MASPSRSDMPSDQVGQRPNTDPHDDEGYEYESWGLELQFGTVRVSQMIDLEKFAQKVKQYSPEIHLSPAQTSNDALPTTTTVSAFFPPPEDEQMIRQKRGTTIIRSVDEYMRGLHLMLESVQNLIIFLPPGIADQVRPLIKSQHVVIYDHYWTVWDVPNLRGRRDDFYTQQQVLASPGGNRDGPYGHPAAWGAWNAKAYFVLEAISIDPFKTSHFAWLDVRTGLANNIYRDINKTPNTWPIPKAVQALYDAGAHPDRAIVTALDRGLRAQGTPYCSRTLPDGGYIDAALEDIWSLNANVIIGSKFAMARLSRAQLLVFERDLARNVFVGREEYQLSYLHFEFEPIITVLEVFRRRPFIDELIEPSMYTYCQLARDDDPDWSGLGLDIPEEEKAAERYEWEEQWETRPRP